MLQNMEIKHVFRCVPLWKETIQNIWFDLSSKLVPTALIFKSLVYIGKQVVRLINLHGKFYNDSHESLEVSCHFSLRLFAGFWTVFYASLRQLFPWSDYYFKDLTNFHFHLSLHHELSQIVIIRHASQSFHLAQVYLQRLCKHVNPAVSIQNLRLQVSQALLPG